MAKKYITSIGNCLEIGNQIAKGGEGIVYELKGIHKDFVLKVYHEKQRSKERKEKLVYMCANQPEGLSCDKFRICWPLDTVYNDGEFVGFIMTKAFENSIMPYHLCQVSIPAKIAGKWNDIYNRDTSKGRLNRILLSTNIIAAVQRVHATGKYVFIDLKPQNILVTEAGKVSIIDLDSVQVAEANNLLFKAPVSTPEYTPPEAKLLIDRESTINYEWDIFSLGVIVYEILCGIHPFTGTAKAPYDNLATISEKIEAGLSQVCIGTNAFEMLPPPHKNFEYFSDNLKNTFANIFSKPTNKKLNRPTAKDLGKVISDEIRHFEKNQEKIKNQEITLKNQYLQSRIYKLESHLEEKNQELTEKSRIIKELNIRTSKNPGKIIAAWGFGSFIIFFAAIILISFVQEKNSTIDNLRGQLSGITNLKNELKTNKATFNAVKKDLNLTKDKLNEVQTKLNLIEEYSPPMMIKNIAFKSGKNGDIFIDYGETLVAEKCYYLYPRLKYFGLEPGTYDLDVKILNPDGIVKNAYKEPYFYTFSDQKNIKEGENTMDLLGWGTKNGNSYSKGKHVYEIMINGTLVVRKSFYIH